MVETQTNERALLARSLTLMQRLLVAAIVAVTAGAFVQSYRQLLDWATRHQVPLWIAPLWPALFDAFIVIGECVLFISIVRRWESQTRWLGWLMVGAGFAGSVTLQWLYLPPGVSWWSRGTAAIVPVGATLGLAAGLVVLKQFVADEQPAEDEQPVVVAPAEISPADELAKRRKATARRRTAALTADSPEAAKARAAIALARDRGQTLTVRGVAREYLRKQGQQHGNTRLASQLLAEGE